jgi:hypothetical protein
MYRSSFSSWTSCIAVVPEGKLAAKSAVNVFVIGYEEPNLRARFGESSERYS